MQPLWSNFQALPALCMCSAQMPLWNAQPALRLLEIDGEESVGRPFRYRLVALDVRSEFGRDPGGFATARTNADALLGQELGVCIRLEDPALPYGATAEQRWRWINGIVTGLRYLDAEPQARRVEITLEPWLVLARLRNHYRIFQHKTVAQILKAVLEPYGWPLDMRCNDQYPELDYQVQYGETDFDFVVRLMAQWGLAYHFEHASVDPQEASVVPAHRLIATDQYTPCEPQPCPAYRELTLQPRAEVPGEDDRPAIHAFDTCLQLHCSHSQVWDYDFEIPRQRLTEEACTMAPTDATPLRDFIEIHWPAGFDLRTQQARAAKHLVQVRQWYAERGNGVSQGHGALRALCAGYSFRLDGHAVTYENKAHRVTGTRLRMRAADEHGQSDGAQLEARCEFDAQSPCRPVLVDAPRDRRGVLHRPRVFGVQSARVVGPPDTSVWTDGHARVKVRFFWDESEPSGEHSSCWIRVAAPAGGGAQGFVGVPRIGQEVLVAFEHGDPDRPLVIGCLRGPTNPPNWILPSQRSLSGWHTRELIDDTGNHSWGRGNHLVFDDTESQLQVQLASDQAHGALSIGRVTRVLRRQGRTEARGDGFELRSDAFGALRAGGGLSLSTDPRAAAAGRIDDRQESMARLLQAAQQQRLQANAAQQAGLPDGAEQARVADELGAAARSAIAGDAAPAAGATDSADAPSTLATPDIHVGSAASLNASAERQVHVAAGGNLSLSSGEHASLSSGASLLASAARGIRLFAWRAGLRLMAYAGDVDIRALHHSVRIWARLRLEENAEHIVIRADKQLVLQGADSALYLDQEGLRVHGTTLQVHAAMDLRTPAPLSLDTRGAPTLQEFGNQARMVTPGNSQWGRLQYGMAAPEAGAFGGLASLVHDTCTQALSRGLRTSAQADARTTLHFDPLETADWRGNDA